MLLSRVYVTGEYVGFVQVHVVSQAIDGMLGFFRIANAANGAYDIHMDAEAASSPGGQLLLEQVTRKAATP